MPTDDCGHILDGVAEAQIEPAEIHADDGIRLAFNRQFES